MRFLMPINFVYCNLIGSIVGGLVIAQLGSGPLTAI